MLLRPALSLLLLGAVGGAVLGCAALGELFRDPDDAVAPLVEPDPLYEEIVSHYVELCAVSQYRPLEGGLGGIPGHAVMYLKGACRDESAPYPRLRPCRYASSDPTEAEGRALGERANLDECTREAAHRSSECSGLGAVACFPAVSQFLWACLEAAPYSEEFCRPVPQPTDEPGVRVWSQRACTGYGVHGGEECPFVLTIVPAFCSVAAEEPGA